MTRPVIIDGDVPMMRLEVGGEIRTRECYVDTMQPEGVRRLRPETHDGEQLVETICGHMFIVRVRP